MVLAHCFYRLTLCDKEPARVMNRVRWLLEIMGHVRNIVTGHVPLSNSSANISKVQLKFLNFGTNQICCYHPKK